MKKWTQILYIILVYTWLSIKVIGLTVFIVLLATLPAFIYMNTGKAIELWGFVATIPAAAFLGIMILERYNKDQP